MSDTQVHIVFADAISAAGDTVPEALPTFYNAEQPFAVPVHFNYKDKRHAIIHSLDSDACPGTSRAIRLLQKLCQRLPVLPTDTRLFLASTSGAIDLMEKAPSPEEPDCTAILLEEAKKLTRLQWCTLISSACSSGQTAIAVASRALRNGHTKHALVLAIDITAEFITCGFDCLGAYASQTARPYDINRDGLILGEGAAALLLSTDDNEPALGTVIDAFESCDASHITAPDLTGNTLARLIKRTLNEHHIATEQIAAIIGHGTGTRHNDISELAAINQLFSSPRPLLSLKGTIGHTLGASGALQVVYALAFIRQQLLPPQAGLETPENAAVPFVKNTVQPIEGNRILSLNVGFGGLNSAMIFEGRLS